MSMLPPCRKSLEQHIKRVNYQVGIWKHAHIANPDTPNPCDGHGWMMVDGHLEPLWYDGEALPQELADMTHVSTDHDSDEESDSDPDDVFIPGGLMSNNSSDSDDE